MSAGQFLLLDYVSSCESRPQDWDGVLGAAAFEGSAHNGAATERALQGGGDLPLAHVRTPVLNEASAVLEVWRTHGRTQPGSHGEVRYARGGDLLFGSVAVEEAQLAAGAASDPRRTALEIATDRAYRQMYATLAATGTPHLVRVWNYLPEINIDTHGLERYRQFNTARHEASLACGRAVAGSVPAASALGAATGSPLTIYFLASRRAPAFIENPRQVSAYRYPAQYGRRSPAFSRATVLGEGSAATLFISGTASIVGHQTLHAGNPAAQTRETLVNIEALREEAARRCGMGTLGPEKLAYKVYVRDPLELPIIRAELHSALGARAALLYLKADICRRDLAVEIEAVGGGGWRPAA
jgi:enamine deaminase RidA (YjgF/YER057c/UK114 family)